MTRIQPASKFALVTVARAGRISLLVLALAVLGAYLATVPVSPAYADNVWVVDTTDWDINLTKTACTGSPNDCSYRGAMFGHVTTNGTAVKDVINFDPAVFPPGAPATIQQLSHGMTLTSNVTVDGAGAGVIWRGVNPGSAECIAFDGSAITVRNMQITNCRPGVWLWGNGNTIGPGLVISDSAIGIRINNGSAMSIIGNRIGTTADGTALHPSGSNEIGIELGSNTSDVTVGGPAPADRNIIAGGTEGVVIEGIEFAGITYASTDHTVLNNYIGTDITGTADLGNFTGVQIGPYASGNIVGGGTGEGNLVSGNSNNVRLEGPFATDNTVTRNLVGIDSSGAAGSMTNGDGISVVLGASENTIGPRNVISNNFIGVNLVDTGTESNVVKGNLIGTTPNGMGIIPNGYGIAAQVGARGNVIGGPALLDGNVIRGNGIKGVLVFGATALFNSIRSNSIYENGAFQPGDQIDNVGGGNTELPSPVVTWSDGLEVRGTACPNCSVDVFSGSTNNPRFFEGTIAAGPGGNFTFTSASPLTGSYVTATATDLDGNTSEALNWLISDQDADGLNNAVDTDDDGDTVLDVSDQCAYSVEDVDGHEDGNGCPDPDNDADGVCDPGQSVLSCAGSDSGKTCFDPAGTLSCPTQDCRNAAEDADAFKDLDGCPEPDNDNDSFPDATDACPGADASTGIDGMFGAPQDANHNGVRDGAEAAFTTDDVMPLLMFEDKDGVLDTDGCHDSPGNDFDGDGLTDDTEVFTLATDPGNPDSDADAITDGADNCPNWTNAAQALPAWTIPANDSDCDGWNKTREQHVGTDPTKHCNTTTTVNDEADAWPGDFNDNKITNLADVISFGPTFNKLQGQPGYNQRYDLNATNQVLLSDVILLGPFFNKVCTG